MTPAPRVLPRRTVLAVSGTAVLAAAAACSADTPPATSTTASSASSSAASSAGSSSAGSSSAAASSPAATSAAAPAPAEPSTAAEAPTTAAPSEAAPTGTPLASVADVESAGSVIVNGADGPVLLAASNGSVVAHTAVCTHQQCTIAASGSCPCHGSRFNITTGAVENGPAQRPLEEISVTVSAGQVFAG